MTITFIAAVVTSSGPSFFCSQSPPVHDKKDAFHGAGYPAGKTLNDFPENLDAAGSLIN